MSTGKPTSAERHALAENSLRRRARSLRRLAGPAVAIDQEEAHGEAHAEVDNGAREEAHAEVDRVPVVVRVEVVANVVVDELVVVDVIVEVLAVLWCSSSVGAADELAPRASRRGA